MSSELNDSSIILSSSELDNKWSSTRSSQLHLLSSLIDSELSSEPLYLFGGVATGKTELTLDVIRSKSCDYIYLDLYELSSEKYIFQSLISQLDIIINNHPNHHNNIDNSSNSSTTYRDRYQVLAN